MTDKELFLEWVDNTISTYEDAPSEVKHGSITVSISMLEELRELINQQQVDIDVWYYAYLKERNEVNKLNKEIVRLNKLYW